MATPGQLIACVATYLGLPETRVRTYYKYLREAGLVTKAGRGLSSPRMTYRDAARLLIVAGGTRFDRDDAATIVTDYAACRAATGWTGKGTIESRKPLRAGNVTWRFDGLHLPLLQDLPSGHTVPDALMAIMEAAATDQIFRGLGDEQKDRSVVSVQVEFLGPHPKTRITIQVLGKGQLFAERINYGYTGNDRATKTPGELRMIRIFTDVTLFPVGYLIHDKWESSDGAPS